MKPTSKRGRNEAFTTSTCKEYVLKFPNLSNRSLASLIYKENAKLFTNPEQVRGVIRLIKGQRGEFSRTIHVDFKKQLAALKKELPKGETDKKEPYYLPKSIKRALILSDIHIPYQDDEALFAALEYGNEHEADCIILNGDTVDFHAISRHEKNPNKRDVAYELDCLKVFLKGLRGMFPKALILYKIGNHDLRLEKYLMLKAPELLAISDFKLSDLCKFNELNIHEIQSMQYIYAGKLPILHGHELPMKSGGDNPANLSKKQLGKQAMFGHFHKTTVANGREFDKGMSYQIYSTGCLCDLYPDYLPINQWNHGFAFVSLKPSGEYHVKNLTVVNGVIY